MEEIEQKILARLKMPASKMEIVLHRAGQAIPLVRGSDKERLEEMTQWLAATPTEPGDRFELRERRR